MEKVKNMTQSELIVKCAENCGNAPKKLLLKDMIIAIAKKDINFCLDYVEENIVWNIVGKNNIEGKNEYARVLNQWKSEQVTQLIIHNIITHGNTASLNGTFILQNDEKIEFCNVYQFGGFGKNAKIKKITSYVIKTA